MYESRLSGKQAACTWGEDLGLLISEMKRIDLVVEVERGGQAPRWTSQVGRNGAATCPLAPRARDPAEAPLGPFRAAAAHQEGRESAAGWLGFCFALLLLFIALLKGPGTGK